jgi:DNA-binding CsgD family transcriptional regulator
MDNLQKEYEQLLSLQDFSESELNYSLLERQIPLLEQMATMSNCVISVFDCCRRRHAFASQNYSALFGQSVDTDNVSDRIHPDDMPAVWKNAVSAMRYAIQHRENVNDLKFIEEYRICNATGKFVRVIEQQSILETDSAGNIWLALSVLDLSPDQNPLKAVKYGIVSKKGNSFLPVMKSRLEDCKSLSPREIEILHMVKEGQLSKEISEHLRISVHTVNTHRQRILEKLDVDNSMEAVKYASELGLLS